MHIPYVKFLSFWKLLLPEHSFYDESLNMISLCKFASLTLTSSRCDKYLVQYLSCRGPEGTFFEGGVFPARLTFPADYPLSPPKMKFTCDIFHPNSKFIILIKRKNKKQKKTTAKNAGENQLSVCTKLSFLCFVLMTQQT